MLLGVLSHLLSLLGCYWTIREISRLTHFTFEKCLMVWKQIGTKCTNDVAHLIYFYLLLELLLLPPLLIRRIWMVSGCRNKTFHLLFLMNVHHHHHHKGIPCLHCCMMVSLNFGIFEPLWWSFWCYGFTYNASWGWHELHSSMLWSSDRSIELFLYNLLSH